MSNQKAVVVDTSVLIHEPESLLEFISMEDTDVIIPIYVVMELDVLKDKKNHISHLARKSSNLILAEANENRIKVLSHDGELNVSSLDKATEIRYVDLLILKTAERNKPSYESLILYTKDVNLRILAHSMQIEARDYISSQPSEKASDREPILIKPSHELESLLARSFWEGKLMLTQEQFDSHFKEMGENQHFYFEKGDKTHLFRFIENGVIPVRKNEIRAGRVKPRNIEQSCALDLLLDDEIKLVALLGKAGTGKTFLTLAAALDKSSRYQRILLSKPVIDVGKGIGFLPGTVGEKMEPWMQSFFDNLEQINPFWDTAGGHESESFLDKNNIEIQPINSIRGRSLKRSFMIIDEAQNLTKHEIKSIITRAAEGTKVVLLGDPQQIDNPYLDENSNGLVYVLERMKHEPIFGATALSKSERSELSDIAADLL